MGKEIATYEWRCGVEEASNTTTLVGLRLSDPVLKAVDHCCDIHNINRSEFFRIAIHLLLQSPIHQVDT